MPYVKVGEKQRHLPYADGWFVVVDDTAKKGDWCAVIASHPYWDRVDDDEIGAAADSFYCLIRSESGVLSDPRLTP